MVKRKRIESFNFPEGLIFQNKFKIGKRLGGGWESEVYRVYEIMTGIERAAKFFFPHRNVANKAAKYHAKKLHKLKSCPILIQYLTGGFINYQGQNITYLISDYVEGEVLEDFLSRQPGKKISPFQALHLLHALAKGMEDVHRLKEYHGDLHSGNIIVQRHGLGFELKVLDLYHWGTPNTENYQHDITMMIRIFYEAIGGQKTYSKMPNAIKDIVCGLKNSLILKKYKNVFKLRAHLENMEWDS